jgi:sugar transferase EpsL
MTRKMNALSLPAKRLFDLAVAGFGLLILAPVIVALGLTVRIKMGPPVIFRMQRPGKRCRPFILYKFRTMNDARSPEGELLPDGDRLTALGKFLRRWSLDELPQLWNVLRGEMSLVGPRPLLMEYLELYTPEQNRRHDVKPGITGWAQINGRNAIAWDEKLALDVWYVDHWNLLLDLRILLITIKKLFRPEGISAPSHATMPRLLAAAPVDNKPRMGKGKTA